MAVKIHSFFGSLVCSLAKSLCVWLSLCLLAALCRNDVYGAIYSEGGENGTGGVIFDTSTAYNPLSSSTFADGPPHSFHLAHPDFANQSLRLNSTVVPQVGTTLSFKSRLSWAGTGQSGHVQVSTNSGASWTDVYVQAGTDSAGELAFTDHSLSLSAYAGQNLQIRFLYVRDTSMTTFSGTADSGNFIIGWFIDMIQVRHSGAATPVVSEGGENGTGAVTLQTSAGYNPLSISTFADAPPHAFHLAHPDFLDQSVRLNVSLTPQSGSTLGFKSRLSWAGVGQSCHVQVSVNAGASWTDLYAQSGTDSAGEMSFSQHTVSLASYAGRSIQIRFLYVRDSSMTTFSGSADSGNFISGWFIDMITVTSVTIGGSAPLVPVISPSPLPIGTVGSGYNYQIVASNTPDGYAASGLPAGLLINPSTGLISGSPATAGNSTVTLSATNAGGTGYATLTLTVNLPAPVLAGSASATATRGQAFLYQILASNGPTSYAASGLPAGLVLNSNTGAIAGTPTTAGVVTATLHATNAAGTGSGTLTITVNPPPPQISGTLNTSATRDQFFTYQIIASNSPTSYGAAGLPAGLSVNSSTGWISGTPTQVGNSTVTLSASNLSGSGAAVLTLTVALSPQPPLISTTAFPSAIVGQSFSYQIAASNNPLSYSATGLPAGLSVNASTGLIAGMPLVAGNSVVTLGAVNAVGGDLKTVTLNVKPATPIIGGVLTASGTTNHDFSYQIIASNNPTVFGATGLPAGLTVNAGTGSIVGIPSVAGVYNVNLTAGNVTATDTKILVLTVENSSSATPLTVSLSPVNGGSVSSGFLGVTDREAGATYSVKATPAPGYVFSNWSGGATGSDPTLVFSMTRGLNLQANFSIDPLLAARGEYNGLARAEVPTNGTTGSLKILVTNGGRFTGKLILAGVHYPLMGSFSANGSATFGDAKRVRRTFFREGLNPLELGLQLDVAAASPHRVTGTLMDAGVVVATISADQALFTDAKVPATPRRNVPAEFGGAYTFVVPAPEGRGISIPRGSGWGRAVVMPNGSIRVAGVLADGIHFTCSTVLSQDGSLPLYVPLYRNGGAICGRVSLVTLAGNDVNGEVVWFRPPLVGRAFYMGGWASGITSSLRGSHYAPPAPGAVTPEPIAVNLLLAGGNLVTNLAAPASFDGKRVTLFQPLAVRGFAFSMNQANGLFSGTFIHPISQRPCAFQGVVLQNQNAAGGFFVGSTESGDFVLEPVITTN